MGTVYWGQASGSSGSRTPPSMGIPYNLDGQLNVSYNPANPWQYVYRMFNRSWAEIMAQRMLQFVRNPNIGYDQTRRKTFWTALENADWDISEIPTSYTDCSALTFACVALAAKEFRSNWRSFDYTDFITSQFDEWVSQTGLAQKIPFTGYQMIKRGDILWRTGHCAIAMNSYEAGDVATSPTWGGVIVKGGLDSSEDIPLTYHPYIRTTSEDGHISPVPELWARARSMIYDDGQFEKYQPFIHK